MAYCYGYGGGFPVHPGHFASAPSEADVQREIACLSHDAYHARNAAHYNYNSAHAERAGKEMEQVHHSRLVPEVNAMRGVNAQRDDALNHLRYNMAVLEQMERPRAMAAVAQQHAIDRPLMEQARYNNHVLSAQCEAQRVHHNVLASDLTNLQHRDMALGNIVGAQHRELVDLHVQNSLSRVQMATEDHHNRMRFVRSISPPPALVGAPPPVQGGPVVPSAEPIQAPPLPYQPAMPCPPAQVPCPPAVPMSPLMAHRAAVGYCPPVPVPTAQSTPLPLVPPCMPTPAPALGKPL